MCEIVFSKRRDDSEKFTLIKRNFYIGPQKREGTTRADSRIDLLTHVVSDMTKGTLARSESEREETEGRERLSQNKLALRVISAQAIWGPRETE